VKSLESVRISWRAITGHKLRSTLTTLGIIIGIAAVIAFQVLGGGFQENLLGDIEDNQDPIITVQTTSDQQTFGQQNLPKVYTQTDVERLRNVSNVAYVAPQATIDTGPLRYDEQNRTVRAFTAAAASPELFRGSLFEFESGEVYANDQEAVVNRVLANQTDNNLSVGDQFTLEINGTERQFTLSGVVDDGSGGPTFPRVYLPLTYYTDTETTPRETTERVYPQLIVGADSFENLDTVERDVETYLGNDSDASQLLANTSGDFSIQVQTIEEALEQFTRILDQIQLFLSGIAAISLLVGSIGIANIMIVSVTERTREIGIMKAVGARKRDVIQLFLVEALILGIIGAVFGVLVGLGFGYIGISLADWPMVYPVDWMSIAVAVGVIVGILSGLYPAWRAARVDPIEALRRE
jgi:putative ABC transport system permease protein